MAADIELTDMPPAPEPEPVQVHDGAFISAVLAIPVETSGRMSDDEALKILLLTGKRGKWLLSQVHPDRNPDRIEEATEATARVNQAMDIRSRIASAFSA